MLPLRESLGQDVCAIANEKIEHAIRFPALTQVEAMEVTAAHVVEHAHLAVEYVMAGD